MGSSTCAPGACFLLLEDSWLRFASCSGNPDVLVGGLEGLEMEFEMGSLERGPRLISSCLYPNPTLGLVQYGQQGILGRVLTAGDRQGVGGCYPGTGSGEAIRLLLTASARISVIMLGLCLG